MNSTAFFFIWCILGVWGVFSLSPVMAAPWDMTKLSDAPAATWGVKAGLTQEVWYDGEPFDGKPTKIFAYVGRPAGAGPFPGVVLVHGGGGEAFREWAQQWAERGYVAIAMDTAGMGPGKSLNPDGGPAQDGATKFRTDLPAEEMWTYHAVAAVIRGHSLLLAMPEVDRDRTAITGISWGGYLTCIVAGNDHRFKAAVPVYGCGYLHENSAWLEELNGMSPEDRTEWIRNWDPSSYLAQVRCPILFLDGTNDLNYPLDIVRKSYELVPQELRTIAIVPELPHGHIWSFPEPDAFIAAAINRGAPVAKLGPLTTDHGIARASITAAEPGTQAELHSTKDVGDWDQRKWISAPARIVDGFIIAELPDSRPLTYFFGTIDAGGVRISTIWASQIEP